MRLRLSTNSSKYSTAPANEVIDECSHFSRIYCFINESDAFKASHLLRIFGARNKIIVVFLWIPVNLPLLTELTNFKQFQSSFSKTCWGTLLSVLPHLRYVMCCLNWVMIDFFVCPIYVFLIAIFPT